MSTLRDKLSGRKMHIPRYRLPFAAVIAVVLANLYLAYLLSPVSNLSSCADAQYTYLGDSYPMRWELPSFSRPVEMSFHEIEAYPLDGPLADDLWTTIRALSTHAGSIRLGPDRRAFAVSMFHQLHCVNTFRRALVDKNHEDATPEHVQHCLAYLRQFFLCAADDTLEPGDFMARQYDVDRVGHARMCRDWSAVYDAARDNWNDWVVFYRESVGRYK